MSRWVLRLWCILRGGHRLNRWGFACDRCSTYWFEFYWWPRNGRRPALAANATPVPDSFVATAYGAMDETDESVPMDDAQHDMEYGDK